MEKPKYVKVTNDPKIGVEIYCSWTLDLLTDDQLVSWEKYKEEELRDRTNQERALILKTPVAIRIKNWANAMNMGIDPKIEEFRKGKIPQLPANYQEEKKFKLPLGVTILTERQSKHFTQFVRKPIKQKIEYGQETPDIHYEGFLVFENIDENKVNEIKSKTDKTDELKVEPKTPFICPECGRVVQSAIALSGHRRSHRKK